MNKLGNYVTRCNAPILFIFIAVLLGVAICCSNALAQSGAGSIQGTVTDVTGAVIPAAAVHVVNVATGVAADTKSNSVGFYEVPELFTGLYRIICTAPGMKTYITSINLLVAQSAVINPVLTAGAVTQRVVVAGNAVQLTTTDNGAITSTLENARISQIPMNGRGLTTLLEMTAPGLENSGRDLNGLVPEDLEYTVDGATTQNGFYGGEIQGDRQLLDPDSVQEVQVEAMDTGAQYASPATVVATTKSGTNALHGTAFETARNNVIGIAKSREDPSNYSAPHYVRNEFGASAGGPIVLPHVYHGKDKSFWFFAYERYSLADSSAVLSEVPTAAMSTGDFSGLINGSGVLQTLYDPSTTANSTKCAATGKANAYCRTPFSNNQIPVSEESPMAKLYYQLVPLPTNSANPLVTDNNTSLSPEFVVEPQVTFRLDHVFSENNRAYLRYTQNLTGTDVTGGPRNRAAGGVPVGAAVAAAGYANSPTNTYLAGIGYTHIFSPTFFAETIASMQWFSFHKLNGAGAVAPTVDFESKLGLPNNFGELGFPSISGLIFSLGSSQSGNWDSQIITTIDENLTKVVGKHQMQFGGRYRRERAGVQPTLAADTDDADAQPTGIYNTSSGANYTNTTNTGYADGSFFLGSEDSYSVHLEPTYDHVHIMEFDAYFQDNYHVSRNLTLNLGLRYEAHPAMWMKYGLMNSFDFKNDAMVLAAPPATLIAEGVTTQPIIANMEYIGVKFETPAEAGMPAALLDNYNLNFLGRGGIAYQLFGGRHGTVLRGAYGRYTAPAPTDNNASHPTDGAPEFFTFTQSYTSASQAVDSLPDELLRYNDPVQFGVMGVNTSNVVNTNATNSVLPGGVVGNTVPPDFPPPFVTETNVTLEQALKGNSALRVSWIWTHSTNLASDDVYNQAATTYQWEMATGTVPPTGGASVIGTPLQDTYSATALNAYDNTTWGTSNNRPHDGWSNDNILEANYQRLFHRGFAYQISYDFSKPMRVGGNTASADSSALSNGADTGNAAVYPDVNYPGVRGTVGTMTPAYGAVFPSIPPPPRPTGVPGWQDWHAMDVYADYHLDSAEPIQHIRFTGIADLPFGRGKRFFGNVNGFVNELIGGFQLAGDGSIQSQLFQPGTTCCYGPAHPIHVYKHRYPIVDCRSGVCEKSFLWFNGYLAPTVTQGVAGSTCTSDCVTGLPADYQPVKAPIDNTPGTKYFGDNEVQITAPNINGGQPTDIAYDTGPEGGDYLDKGFFNGPINYTEDISIFKVFPIREGMSLRINADAFNALNVQGWNNPGDPAGVQTNLSSANSPRQIQITARLTF